jgi:hypothetical protein
MPHELLNVTTQHSFVTFLSLRLLQPWRNTMGGQGNGNPDSAA